MAGRGNKVSLDYFELDCHMDTKIKLIEAEYGLKGFALVVKLYQSIYGGEFGYYCEWTPDISLLWASQLCGSHGGVSGSVGIASDKGSLPGFPNNLINNIVAASIRRDIFSEKLFHEYGILTSSGIQKQYLKATLKRESVEMKKEYLLITIPKNRENVVINSISGGINTISGSGNEYSKVEYSKVEYSKVDNILIESKDSICPTEVRRVLDSWNGLSDLGIRPVRKISSSTNRYKMLMARIQQYGVDSVVEAIERVRKSTFLQSGSQTGWQFDFEWFVRPNNFPKVLEGKYDDRTNHNENCINDGSGDERQ